METAFATDAPPLRTDAEGVIRIGSTRVTLDTLIAAYEEGLTVEEIAEQYPALRLADIHLAIGYVLNHREDVNEYLRRRHSQVAAARIENEKRRNHDGVRERLLARRK